MWFRPPRWNDDNLLSQLYSGLLSSIILLKVYPCILSTRGSNHHQCGCRVLNTLSVKYRVRTIMKIIQIFQILTVSPSKIPDEHQTIARHFLRREKAIKGLYLSDHQRSSRSTNAQSHLNVSHLRLNPNWDLHFFWPASYKTYCSNIGGKNHFEPVLMVGGIQLAVVIKAWQRVWWTTLKLWYFPPFQKWFLLILGGIFNLDSVGIFY